MSAALLTFVSACYVATAFDLYRRGQFGMATAFIAYAAANGGLIMAIYEAKP